jgi:hypothetical protein
MSRDFLVSLPVGGDGDMSCDISALMKARDLISPRVVKWNKAAALVRTGLEHKSDGRSRILRPHCMLTYSRLLVQTF